MNKSAWTVSRLHLGNIKAAYLVTGILFFVMTAQDLVKLSLASQGLYMGEEVVVSSGNLFWLLIPLGAAFIASRNFRRIANLGGRRKSYFEGSLIAYLILSAAVSFVTTLLYYTYDHFIVSSGSFLGRLSLLEIFGWSAHGPIAAFFQQFAFLFLLAAFTHTLTMAQDSWIGWAADLLIAAVIAVFTPIEPLRAVLVWFFNLIIFQQSAPAQILACLALGGLIYALSRPILSKKAI